MRGWFGKSQAQLDAEKALVAEQKRKAVEERNAVLKAKGIEKNPDFKTFKFAEKILKNYFPFYFPF